jgi:hypothetical protein
MIAEADIKARYEALRPWLDERARRLLAAAESQAIGPGGISAVSRATGVSRRSYCQKLCMGWRILLGY